MKHNNSTEPLGRTFIKMYNKNGSPDPPRPQIRILFWIPRIFYRKSIFSIFLADTNIDPSATLEFRCKSKSAKQL